MDPESFIQYPELPPSRAHAFAELHIALQSEPPKPAIVRIRSGYWLLPRKLWGVAELAARAAQDLEIDEIPRCRAEAFLTHILTQAITARGVLTKDDGNDGVLSLLVACKSAVAAPLPLTGPAPMLALTDVRPDTGNPSQKRATRAKSKQSAWSDEQLFVA